MVMATTPFSASLIANLKGKTAWRFEGEIGEIFTPRFFCCTDPNTLGIADGKEPVAILSLSPNPVFVGDTVNFDGTDSYDPDGSIASYAFTFASGTPASSSSDSGTVSWAAAGSYEVTLVVTDGTGVKSTPARAIQTVADPDTDAYVATATGVWYGTGNPPSWSAKNTGLSGDDLTVYDVKIDPATQGWAEGSKTIWRATAGGIQVSNDGGATWTEKNPASVTDQWGDGVTVADLEFKQLLFAGDKLFVAATWLNGSDYRSWVFYTTDHPAMRSDPSQTVTWTEITTTWET